MNKSLVLLAAEIPPILDKACSSMIHEVVSCPDSLSHAELEDSGHETTPQAPAAVIPEPNWQSPLPEFQRRWSNFFSFKSDHTTIIHSAKNLE